MDPDDLGSPMLASTPHSTIQLSSASQAFVDNRITTLGPWVISAALDCVLMGIIFCQVEHYWRNKRQEGGRRIWDGTSFLVALLTVLSILKTIQSIVIIWHQNVVHYADPDVARTLLSVAWWQVSAPLMTGVIGGIVQCFYGLRYFRLTKNYFVTSIIYAAICLNVVGGGASTYFIIKAVTKEKVLWLLIHLISVCVADILITVGTLHALYRRSPMFSSVVRRVMRMIFEAAVPPAVVATADLILTQTLKHKLLWHLPLNYVLAKLYVISLLYTVNCISDHRRRESQYSQSHNRYRGSSGLSISQVNFNFRVNPAELELGSRYPDDAIHVKTEISRQLSGVDSSETASPSGRQVTKGGVEGNISHNLGQYDAPGSRHV